MTTSEGGALPEEYLVKYVVGRVDTTARLTGTSMAGASVMIIKYDPVSQREFYQFLPLFNQVPENGLDVEELNPCPGSRWSRIGSGAAGPTRRRSRALEGGRPTGPRSTPALLGCRAA
jgi:hypothetical protein